MLADISGRISALYRTMAKGHIKGVEKLEIEDRSLVERSREIVKGHRISTFVSLANRVILLQGTTPEPKKLSTLIKATNGALSAGLDSPDEELKKHETTLE